MECTKEGWLSYNEKKNPNSLLTSFYRVRKSISVNDNCLYYGDRVVIPSIFQVKVLNILHDQHIGIVRMKLLARDSVWWPLIDTKIDLSKAVLFVKKGKIKQKIVQTLHGTKLIFLVDVDLFQFGGKDFLIALDDYIKWISLLKNLKI